MKTRDAGTMFLAMSVMTAFMLGMFLPELLSDTTRYVPFQEVLITVLKAMAVGIVFTFGLIWIAFKVIPGAD